MPFQEKAEVSTINLKPDDGKLYLWNPEDRGSEPQKKISTVSVKQAERGGWGNQLDFLFSCISVSVGLGNVWRFPYLCYKHGGGAFVITYMVAMVMGGIPLFYQEVALGQYLGQGGMNLVGIFCPILKGTGFATMTIVFLLDTYYCIIIAWTLFYLFSCFSELRDLPWEHYGHYWNSDECSKETMWNNYSIGRNLEKCNKTPVEEFWDMTSHKRALQEFTQELVVSLENLKARREALQIEIDEEELEKSRLRGQLGNLSLRLTGIMSNLTKRTAARANYDRVIAESEAALCRLLDHSQTVAYNVRRETVWLTGDHTPLAYPKSLEDNPKDVTNHNRYQTGMRKRVLDITDGITNFGGIRWELLGLLFLAWILVYLVIYKGLHQSGKIIWFTALFPYVILFVLLGRAVTLEGAADGLLLFVKPDWSKLASAGAWIDGATQIFFAYSIGIGTLPALGSYNKFNHNCHRDAIITCAVNTVTCLLAGCLTFAILGYLAHVKGCDVDKVVDSGPGLVFITYPEVVLQLQGAPMWAIIFFIMLAILGIDSEFCNVESFITGVSDNWAKVIQPHRMKFAFSVCFIMFLCGIPMVFQGGPYLFQLMDFYSASGLSLLWVCFFQTVAISWIYGVDRVNKCIYEMMGLKPNLFWNIAWKFLSPLIMVAIFMFFCLRYEPVKYADKYEYPWWGELIGLLLSFSSMIWIPGYAIYFLIKTPGTLKERLQKGITPQFSKLQKRAAVPEENSPSMPMSNSQAVLINTP